MTFYYCTLIIDRFKRVITNALEKKRKRKRNLTKYGKVLFQLIKKKSEQEQDGRQQIFSRQCDVHALQQFFKNKRLSIRRFDINCLNENNLTPLMIASWEYDNILEWVQTGEDDSRAMEVIMILLENGANVNMQISNGERIGQTALHIACRNGSSNVTKLLLCHGADPNLHDEIGNTPLLTASVSANYDNMKVLLEYGGGVNVNDNYSGDTPVHNILRNGNYYYGKRAVTRGVKLLLQYGVDINVPNRSGVTPLHLAVHQSCREARTLNSLGLQPNYDAELALIRLLLDANADMSMQLKNTFSCDTNIGDTPLHIVVRILRTGMIQMVQLLMEYHPNLCICNNTNETVLDIAKEQRFNHNITSFEELELDAVITLIEDEIRHQIYTYLINCWIP